MAEVSGFFTSSNGDRRYTAGFFNRRLHEAMQRAEGVVRGAQGELALGLGAGLFAVVNTGAAFKGGVVYLVDDPVCLELEAVASGFLRVDRVVARLDTALRTMQARVLRGTVSGSEAGATLPSFVPETDVLLGAVRIDRRSGAYCLTAIDEREFRPRFFTDRESLDEIRDGTEWKRIRAGVAESLNAGIFPGRRMQLQYLASLGGSGGEVTRFAYESGLVAGSYPGGRIYRSDSGGTSWIDCGRLGSEDSVRALCAVGYRSFVAGTGPTGQVFRSSNGGASWADCGRLGGAGIVYDFATNRNYAGPGTTVRLLAATDESGNVYASADGGVSFSLAGRPGSESITRSLVAVGGNVFLAGTGGSCRIYRSTDCGTTWTLAAQLSTAATEVTRLAMTPLGTILAGTGDPGEIHYSLDSGLSWQKASVPGDAGSLRDFAVLSEDAIYAGFAGEGGLCASADGGKVFRHLQDLGTEGSVTALLRLHPACLLAGTGELKQIHRGSAVYL